MQCTTLQVIFYITIFTDIGVCVFFVSKKWSFSMYTTNPLLLTLLSTKKLHFYGSGFHKLQTDASHVAELLLLAVSFR